MIIRHRRRQIGEFVIHTMANDAVSMAIAPELGGRIVSMRDRISGREWMDGWSPTSKRRLWKPSDPSDFETGPGAGLDECLPTVLACSIRGKAVPDHGDLWNKSPEFTVDPKRGFTCRWTLRSLPLAFERRISLERHGFRFDYRIENLAEEPTPFLWAWHPLFTWKRGDQISFPFAQKTCFGGGQRMPWPVNEPGNDLSRALFPRGASCPAAKVFLGPLEKGCAEIRSASGASLSISWPAHFFPYAGIWITRGFWKGLHHWAIEPTNAPVDRLSEIEESSPSTLLTPCEVREWKLEVTLAQGTRR